MSAFALSILLLLLLLLLLPISYLKALLAWLAFVCCLSSVAGWQGYSKQLSTDWAGPEKKTTFTYKLGKKKSYGQHAAEENVV